MESFFITIFKISEIYLFIYLFIIIIIIIIIIFKKWRMLHQ